MNKLKRFTALMFVVIFSVVLAGCSGSVVAEVNNEKITKSQLEKRVEKEKLALEKQGANFSGDQGKSMLEAVEAEALKKMIEQILIIQTAKKEDVYPSKTQIAENLKLIKDNFGSEEEFDKALKEYGYTLKELEENIGYETAYEKLYEKITAKVKVDDEQLLKQWYDDNKAKYINPAKIGARTILTKLDGRTEEEALKIAVNITGELLKGADFATLAKEKSEDDYFKADGGLVKDMAGKSPYDSGTLMPPEFDAAAVELKPGEFTLAPVKTEFGYFIIKLESLTPEKQLTFNEAKEIIANELLLAEKQEVFGKYMSEAYANSKVTNKLEKEEAKDPAATDEPAKDSSSAPAK